MNSLDLGLSESELRFIRAQTGLELIDLNISPNWNSRNPTHSSEIHCAIKLAKENNNRITTSISHSLEFGGFAYLESSKPHQIGFDIEQVQRLTEPVVQRIAFDENEIKSAPDLASLWCAKEAAFKALRGPKQPQVISKLKISGWLFPNLSPSEKFNSQFKTYQIGNAQDFEITGSFGFSWFHHNNCFSVCVLLP